MMRSTSSPVPTGTVDLVTTTVKPSISPAISRGGARRRRTGRHGRRRAATGVPTAMKATSLAATFTTSVENDRRPERTLSETNCSIRLEIGIAPDFRASILKRRYRRR